MVVTFSIGKKNLLQHDAALQDAAARLVRARAMFLQFGEEDAVAYGQVNDLQKLQEGDPRRIKDLPVALRSAVDVPLAAMALSVDVLRLYVTLHSITNRFLRSDLGIAAVLAEAANRSSAWNVNINLGGLTDGDAAGLREQSVQLLETGTALAREIEVACRV
jgi:formiminotetrahydrofolate cyclodeaminase